MFVLFAAVYLVRFEVMDGDNQETELAQKIDVAEYMKTAQI
jgi:cytochrome c oxidase cbb3-type subunit 3